MEVEDKLVRDPHSHLSVEELARLVETAQAVPHAVDIGFDEMMAKSHAADCSICGPRLRALQFAQASIRGLMRPGASKRTSDCPAEDSWPDLAAGVSSPADAASLLEHVSKCDYCGNLLKQATLNFNVELSPGEIEILKNLPSSKSENQQVLAMKMAELSLPTARNNATAVSVGRSASFWRQPWTIPAAAALFLALIAGIWLVRSSQSLTYANKLILQAYSENRPLILRFPEAHYATLYQKRGGKNSSRERPPALGSAESLIAHHTTIGPFELDWLHAKARADLLEGNYQAAISALLLATSKRPDDQSLKIDLAIAYFELAESNSDSPDYQPSIRLLSEVLKRRPDETVALFNRAIVYQKQKRYSEATADWTRYLQVDPSGEWSGEARQHLAEISHESTNP